MKIADFSIKHPAIITILLIAVLLFGGLSLRNLKQDLLADITLPSAIVFTEYPGVGPRDIERDITDILEEELGTLTNISSISSVSEHSASIITIEFNWDVQVRDRIADIREKINGVMSDLPDGISGPPKIFSLGASQIPIYTVSVESNLEQRDLTDFLEDQVVPFLSRIDGVAQVNLEGGSETIVDITTDIDKLESKNIAVLDVYQLLRNHNITYPAGSVELHGQSLNVRTAGDFASVEEVREVVVGYRDNTYIRLKEIADVSLSTEDPDTYITSGEKNIIIIDIMKQPGADTQAIIEDAKQELDKVEQEHGELVQFNVIADQSGDIELAISSVKNAAITGGILAIFILFLFLHRLRTTLIVGVSIPLSIVIAFIIMNLQGLHLNLISLGGLTVAIGMMVDSSIVVLENIHRNFDRIGDRKKAASIGTGEVGGAIIASTSTSLSVFFPILFVSGLAGIILKDGAYSLIYALAASLLAAIIVVPFLSSLLLKKRSREPRVKLYRTVEQSIDSLIDKLTEWYKRALSSAIGNRGFVLLVAVAVLALSVLATDFLGFSFIPSTDMNEIQIEIETPEGYTLEMTKAKVEEMHEIIKNEVPEMEASLYYVGQGGTFGFSSSPSQAFGRIRIAEKKERDRSVFTIIDLLGKKIQEQIPDLDATVLNGGLDAYSAAATGGSGFIIEVFSNDMDKLISAATMVEEIMNQDPDVTKTELNVRFDRQEIVTDLHLDYLGNLGITPYEAAVTSRIIFNGMEVGTFHEEGKSHELFLNSDIAGEKITRDVLNRIFLKSREGRFISYASFADMNIEPSISAIHHENKMKSIRVTGYLRGSDIRGTTERVTNQIEKMSLPVGVDWQTAGSAAEISYSFTSLITTMLIAVFLVYMVMVIQFERFTQPLIVMAAVPFTVIGVIGSLLLFGSTLSIVSFMGIIALAGIVVNNAIVMIDYINLLRKRDELDLMHALLEGASTRLKPILMTTLTTILGLLPMAIGLGEGAEVYAPLGQAIAGGLVTSTLITLFLVPTLYYIVEVRVGQIQRLKGNKQ